MKKNLKLKILTTIFGCLLLCTGPSQASDAEIVDAINTMQNAVIGAIQENNAELLTLKTQISTSIDGAFTGTFDAGGKIIQPGSIYKWANNYIKKFYLWFSDKWFKKSLTKMSSLKEIEKNSENIKKMLSQEIGYNLEKRPTFKKENKKALLAQQMESRKIDNLTPLNPIQKTKLRKKGVSPEGFGGLDDNASTKNKIPNVVDLLGPATYNDKQKKQAKLFLSYILAAMPTRQSIYIEKKFVELPKPDLDGNPVTKVTVEDYGAMKEYLENDDGAKYYLPYKRKARSASVLRSVFLDNLMRPYQERVKGEGGKSIVEKEREAALAGLDKKYYKKLRSMSMADIALENLYAKNKQSYFLNKIHEDLERIALIFSVSGLSLTSTDNLMDSQMILNPLMKLLSNRCWRKEGLTEEEENACNVPAGTDPESQDTPEMSEILN